MTLRSEVSDEVLKKAVEEKDYTVVESVGFICQYKRIKEKTVG